MTDADVENWKLKCPECGFTRTKIRKTGMEYIAPGVHATKEDEDLKYCSDCKTYRFTREKFCNVKAGCGRSYINYGDPIPAIEDEVPNPEEITKTICTSCGKETLHWYFERVSLARSWWDF